MNNFQELFSARNIILYLCKLRAKQAKVRNKKHTMHLLTSHISYNYHVNDFSKMSEFDKKLTQELDELLPKRRQWKRIGEKYRYKNSSSNSKPQKINSTDVTIATLTKTINYFRVHQPNEPFLKRLDNFISDIQKAIIDNDYKMIQPTIYPKPKDLKTASQLKENEKNICRPIALFHLKDRLIIGFTNKYLTELFDKYFEKDSLAFRATQEINGQKVKFSHHDAIQKIAEFKTHHSDSALWVAECDMKKFYDSVNHEIALESFNKIIQKAEIDNPNLDLTFPRLMFEKYLDSYCFKADVLEYNKKEAYWAEHRIASGSFDWIDADLKNLKYYNYWHKFSFSKEAFINFASSVFSFRFSKPTFTKARIGIPQGGALSGLIANIVLDYVDKNLRLDQNFLYIRFCDDMILMHPDQFICEEKIQLYKSLLHKLRLVPHKFGNSHELYTKKNVGTGVSLEPFWRRKSKGPYKWEKADKGGFPWIGFVGYEVHCDGAVRIRKSSLQKELEKQKIVVENIKKAIAKGKRVTNNEIAKSAIMRLIGMSVGRMDLWNHDHVSNEMCWKIGFRRISNDKHTIRQIKQLDRSRSRLYYGLVKHLKNNGTQEQQTSSKGSNYKIVFYDKPFSYYHQVLTRGNS